MKSIPAQVNAERAMIVARMPGMPGTGEKIRAVKCNPIMTHAVSQILDAAVLLLRATEAKAQAKSATAATSGNLLQSSTTPL